MKEYHNNVQTWNTKIIDYLKRIFMWVPISSTDKVANGCMRNLRFNPRLHQKLIGILI